MIGSLPPVGIPYALAVGGVLAWLLDWPENPVHRFVMWTLVALMVWVWISMEERGRK